MKLNTIDISMLDDFMIGNAEDRGKGTGCTVIVCEKGAVGGVDVRGGGPATRETDLLKSENTAETINGVILSGGSAFGLEAASGVTRELAEHGIGFRMGDIVVPLVCGASLFDLNIGDCRAFPDVKMGIEATRNAFNGRFRNGNSGAGTGASVGKTFGIRRAMKTGLGTFACGDGSIEVGAVVAVNAMGDVYNGAGNIIAGLRSEDGRSIYGTIRALKDMVVPESPKKPRETVAESDRREAVGSMTRVEHRERMREVARAIKEEFRKTNQYKKSDILEADKRFKEDRVRQEMLREEQRKAMRLAEEKREAEKAAEAAAIAPEPAAAKKASVTPGPVTEETAAAAPVPETAAGHGTAAPQSFIDDKPYGKHMRRDEAAAYEEDEEEIHDAEKQAIEDFLDEFEETAKEDADLGYDIPFNTTIGCLITNAKLTKAQANKLASILHDAYARAIKPVHSTLDGDTVFVLASGKQEVNFDAFAALATDVMQYAIIDAAMSAKPAYGLPSASDFAARR